MSLIADGLLIAAGLTAGLYCFILSRRLKAFSSTESGIGQEIRQLNETLAETREALHEAKSNAQKEAEALARDIAQARKLSTQLVNLIADAEKSKDAIATAGSGQPAVVKSHAAKPIGVPEETVPEPESSAPAQELAGAGEDDIEAGEIGFEEATSGADGELQLGFMPDSADDDSDNEALAEDAPVQAQADPEEPVSEDPAVEEEDLPELPGDVAAAENLLKVERMAL